ncbi:MAG: hypothetical protein EON98_16475 [Chitinophagaceae bacterium]|nr:MAG: hypothetical protein EON98_16475 [Chitinophagaceae bacterium]
MKLVTPEYGLAVWTFLCLTALVLSVVAIISILRNQKIGSIESLGWIVLVMFVPFIGAIVYFKQNKSRKINNYV